MGDGLFRMKWMTSIPEIDTLDIWKKDTREIVDISGAPEASEAYSFQTFHVARGTAHDGAES